MKSIVSFDQAVGGDGLKVQGGLGVEGTDLVAQVKAVFPIAQVIEPAMKVLDGMVDKIEQIIPGDQKGIAAGLKADAREQLMKLVAAQAKDVTPDPAP